MDLQTEEITNKKLWEDFVLGQKEQGNFLQSWNWGETHRLLGRKVFRFGFYRGSSLQGVALLVKQEAKRGNYLESPGGPIINWQEPSCFEKFVQLLKETGKREGCLFVRVRPQIVRDRTNKGRFKKAGFLPAPMHLHAQDTWILDITKDEKTLLSQMRKTTRYCIRKAIKEKVKVVKSVKETDVEILYKLQKETAKRHNFIPFPFDFLQAHFKAFVADDQIKIFKAIYKGKVLSIAMIVFYGKRAVYHYSASSSAFSKVPASYLIQWEAIKEAKKRGCAIYDFWGITLKEDRKHRFYGVTLFKKGFGGQAFSYLPAQDLPLKWNYWPVFLFETGRRMWRRL